MKKFSTDQDYNLWMLLDQTTESILKVSQKELGQYNISTIKVAALLVIETFGHKPMPVEIARRLFRRPHTVFGLLRRMEKQGLVRLAKDLDKKNQVRVELTEKGHEVYNQSTKRQSLHEIMSSLSKEECRQLILSLQILRDKALKRLTSGPLSWPKP